MNSSNASLRALTATLLALWTLAAPTLAYAKPSPTKSPDCVAACRQEGYQGFASIKRGQPSPLTGFVVTVAQLQSLIAEADSWRAAYEDRTAEADALRERAELLLDKIELRDARMLELVQESRSARFGQALWQGVAVLASLLALVAVIVTGS